MRRPHRTIRHRISRRLVASGKELPPAARHRLRRLADGLSVATSGERGPRGPVETVTTFDYWAMLADLAATALAVLSRAGVEVVRLDRDGQTILAVPAESRPVALSALAADPVTAVWWLAAGVRHPTRLGSGRAPAGAGLSLFRLLAAVDGTPLTRPRDGLRLEFWRTTQKLTPRPDGGSYPPGTRLAPVPNRIAGAIIPDLWREAQLDPQRRLRPQAPPPLVTLTEPVDIVYTWVDDKDPAWQQRRASVAPPSDALPPDSLHSGRTQDNDELRYSLRSVASNAGWFRRIWLVTDGQVPGWLVDHPRLTVVPHREIFTDPQVLPTFNSHAIESQLHHIDGLAEHFIYFNDDVFLGRPVRPELFFSSTGVAKFTIAPIAIDRQEKPGRLNGAMLAARNNRSLIAADFHRTITNRIQHIPHPHRRSSLTELEQRHPELVAAVSASRFRSAQDVSIASELGHYWAYTQGKAVTTRLAFEYVDIGSPLAPERLDYLLARRNQDCFCINDAGPYPEPVQPSLITDFLARYFPVASPFEAAR